jgi:hypothetical protein
LSESGYPGLKDFQDFYWDDNRDDLQIFGIYYLSKKYLILKEI